MNSFKQKWAGYSEKKKRILTALACILCFILLLSLFIALKLARIQYDPAPETEHEEPASTPAETDQQFAGKGRSTVNILVLGTDLPLPGTGDLGRCDSTTLLSLNLLTGQIKAISFERGISIYIPSIWSYDLLTHVYSHEGATGMVNAIETNFGVDIDGYVQINFDTFPQVVDAIGGVDIDLTDEEVTALNNEGYIYAGVWTQAYVTPGRNHLNGHDTLEYARLRAVDDNFGRQQRQRTVMQAMLKQVRKLTLFQMNQAANKILSLIHTNLPKMTLVRLMLNSVKFVGADLQQLQVPEKNGSTEYTMSTFSYQEQRQRIAEFLA